MSLRKVIDWAIEDKSPTKTGYIASPFYEFYDGAGQWVWACDVDIGEPEVLRCVPVAANNREILYAEQGRAVTLSRLGTGRWVITGLAKTRPSTVHFIYLGFEDDVYRILRTELRGYVTRPLTYGELGTLMAPYGYGVLPYGIWGRFDYNGNLLEIVERH